MLTSSLLSSIIGMAHRSHVNSKTPWNIQETVGRYVFVLPALEVVEPLPIVSIYSSSV